MENLIHIKFWDSFSEHVQRLVVSIEEAFEINIHRPALQGEIAGVEFSVDDLKVASQVIEPQALDILSPKKSRSDDC